LEFLLPLRDVICKQKKLKKLIFVNKNWPNDLQIGCKFAFDLLEFFKRYMNFEEELEEFEKDEIVEMQKFNK
jgi:hypothetical protein